jgi:phosphohistidine phosphatase
MLVGHNPAFAELAGRLSDAITGMPTCAVAEFAFATRTWSDLGALAPTKARLRVPRKP